MSGDLTGLCLYMQVEEWTDAMNIYKPFSAILCNDTIACFSCTAFSFSSQDSSCNLFMIGPNSFKILDLQASSQRATVMMMQDKLFDNYY